MTCEPPTHLFIFPQGFVKCMDGESEQKVKPWSLQGLIVWETEVGVWSLQEELNFFLEAGKHNCREVSGTVCEVCHWWFWLLPKVGVQEETPREQVSCYALRSKELSKYFSSLILLGKMKQQWLKNWTTPKNTQGFSVKFPERMCPKGGVYALGVRADERRS